MFFFFFFVKSAQINYIEMLRTLFLSFQSTDTSYLQNDTVKKLLQASLKNHYF